MPSIEVNGVSLFYEDKGKGQPVVFVHGIPTDYRVWVSQVEAFSGRFRAVAYSRRYAHPNERQGDLLDSTIENNVADLVGLISKLGMAPVHLVGHSYGGFIAAYLAAGHEELLRSLTLVEPAVSTLLVKNPKSILEFLSLLIRDPSVASSAARFLRKGNNPAFKALDEGDLPKAVRLNVDAIEEGKGVLEELPAQVKAMMIDNARTVGELRTRFPSFTRADAGRIKSPSLVINGEMSPLFLRKIGQILAASIPQCESLTILGARHFPHFENAPEFNSGVLGFLLRQSGV